VSKICRKYWIGMIMRPDKIVALRRGFCGLYAGYALAVRCEVKCDNPCNVRRARGPKCVVYTVEKGVKVGNVYTCV
jgi:hypothetical protein